jgi:hypothetical protein
MQWKPDVLPRGSGSMLVALTLGGALLTGCSGATTNGEAIQDGGRPGNALLDAGAPPSDAAAPSDAPSDATIGEDAPQDAQTPGLDSTVETDSASSDATDGASSDATDGASSDATDGASSDATDGASSDVTAPPEAAVEAGVDCATLLSALLQAPLTPPNIWLGLDLSNGGQADGGLGSGGLSIDQTGLLGCASYVEPPDLEAGVAPAMPGYRTAFLVMSGDAGPENTVVQIAYNLESREIYQVAAYVGYQGQLQFHSRIGGAYGSHTYTVSIEPAGGASSDTIVRDGVPFPNDWSNAWINEMYDAMMATFDPTVAAVPDCTQAASTTVAYGIPISMEGTCLDATGQLFGVRPLALYLGFDGNNQVNLFYNFWRGSQATGCATPLADRERMADFSVAAGASVVDNTLGVAIGGLPGLVSDNDAGLTVVQANTILGCNGTSWTSPDPGYGGMQWGDGAVAMEYDPDSGVNYKIIAQSGYVGTWSYATAATADAGVQTYTIGIGTMSVATEDDAGPLSIDWTSVATATPTVTQIANAWYETYCSAPPDADCVALGDCSIVIDDGQGHSRFVLAPSAAMIANNCYYDIQPVTFVFPQGSSSPEQIYVTNSTLQP